MEVLLEFLMEFILEGSSYIIMEAKQRKKYPFWLRLICTLVLFAFALLMMFIAVGIFALGIKFLKEQQYFVGGMMFFVDIVIFVYGITFVCKGYHTYQKHHTKIAEDELDGVEETVE